MRMRPVNVIQRLLGLMFMAFFGMSTLDWELPGVPPAAEPFRSAIVEAGYFFPTSPLSISWWASRASQIGSSP